MCFLAPETLLAAVERAYQLTKVPEERSVVEWLVVIPAQHHSGATLCM
jgi:hypothetical protein